MAAEVCKCVLLIPTLALTASQLNICMICVIVCAVRKRNIQLFVGAGISRPIVVMSPLVVPNLPRLRLCHQLGCSVGDMTCSSCCALEVPCLASLSDLSFPGISQCPGIHCMDVSTSFWLCGLFAVFSMSVTIGLFLLSKTRLKVILNQMFECKNST